jgi:DNA-binding IclR family transcriptional regulator
MRPRHSRQEADSSAKSPRQSIQVIARAAKVLRALEGEDQGLSLGQIAQRVGLARSTVQRIVDSLSAEQFVIAASPSSGVRLGPALIRLAASAHLDIGLITHPIMLALAQEVGETVDLSVLKGSTAVFVDQVQGAHRLRAVSAIGEAFPLHCTANGKALLSVVEGDALERVVNQAMSRATPNSPARRAELMREVESARRTGLAFDSEEHTEGICAVGTGFLDPVGRPMALSIPVPAARFKRSKAVLSRALLAARQDIIKALGTEPR